MNGNQGFTDKAAVKDLFKIDNYIKGLSDFIKVCNTPMTISIQGSWGTGKTSIMNFIEKELLSDGTIEIVKFNTWQFSQFNMQDQLALSLISSIIKQIKVDAEQSAKLQRFKSVIAKGVVNVFGGAISSATCGIISKEDVQETVNGLVSDKDDYDIASAISDLKKEFENCIQSSLKKNNKQRIVFFVDDLDRLEPKKAVELLEVLKLFFDVEHCIYVLGIDYDVVIKGVADKYGRFFKDDKDNLEKGKSFFDKIIQVPFKMPVGKYNLDNYVQQCFADIGVPCNPDELPIYVDLINLSVGGNPRSMKRLFNAFLLLTKIVDQEILEKDKSKQLLFAVLCLQYSFDSVYNYILRERENLSEELLKQLADPNWDYTQSDGNIDLSNVNTDRLLKFMEKFNKTIDYSVDGKRDGKLSEGEIEMLKSVLGVASITGSAQEIDSGETNLKSKKKYYFRYNGVVYESGNRSGRNLGNLGYAIIKDAAENLNWNANDVAKFRATIIGQQGSTGWLNEIVMFANEVKELEFNPTLINDEPEIRRGVKRTASIEKFKDRYFSYMKKEDIVFDEARARADEQSIILSDGSMFFVARYWGANDLKRLKEALAKAFNYNPEVVQS